MAVPKMYNVHTHIFNFKCVPEGFLSNYLPRAMVSIIGPLLRIGPIAWFFSRIMRAIPVDMVKKYQAFVAIGIRNTPQKVFEEMLAAYTGENVGFVVLPMNFDYMGGGKAPANYLTQLELTADVKRKYPNQCFPFISVDPRMGNAGDILNFVKSYFEPDFKGFHGIKLYPSLGFFPFDERLEKMYAYAEEKQIPVLTHCTRFGAFYAGRTVPPELLLFNSFNKNNITDQRHTQDFYKSFDKMEPKDICDAFLDPVNYYDVLDKFPNLKLCFAHYGGDTEIVKYLKSSGDASQGDISTGYNNDTSWYFIIKDFMAKFKNVYTDISYTLYDTKPNDHVVDAIAKDLQEPSGNRILFGTDFFMTLQEKDERPLYTEFRAALNSTGSNTQPLWENLIYYNNKQFLSSSFYTIP